MNEDFEIKSVETKKASGTVKERAKKVIPYLFLAIALTSIGLAGYFWREAQTLKEVQILKGDSQKTSQEEIRELLADVSTLIVLPEGEDPIIATVTDNERLKGQLFFAKAKIGDKVLIYSNARKAILYDPIAKKIVEVSPINIGDEIELK